jgi:IMP dehydrogenase/GMP reductase
VSKPIQYATALAVDDVLLLPGHGRVVYSKNIELYPFICSAPMDTVTGYRLTEAMLAIGEYAVIPRWTPGCKVITREEYLSMLKDFATHPNCFIAVNSSRDEFDTLFKNILECGLELQSDDKINICVDTAHGFSDYAIAAVRAWATVDTVRFVMSGSIATAQAVIPLAEAGATHLRVGIGPGSACTTRLVTGVGVPQFTAVEWVVNQLNRTKYKYPDVKVIADGGIRNSGDAAKYIALGADMVMLGSVLSKTAESPGWIDNSPMAQPHKFYRGQASAEYQIEHYGKASAAPEGLTSPPFSWNGDTVESVVNNFRTAMRRTISYTGHTSLEDMCGRGDFVAITSAAKQESSSY